MNEAESWCGYSLLVVINGSIELGLTRMAAKFPPTVRAYEDLDLSRNGTREAKPCEASAGTRDLRTLKRLYVRQAACFRHGPECS